MTLTNPQHLCVSVPSVHDHCYRYTTLHKKGTWKVLLMVTKNGALCVSLPPLSKCIYNLELCSAWFLDKYKTCMREFNSAWVINWWLIFCIMIHKTCICFCHPNPTLHHPQSSMILALHIQVLPHYVTLVSKQMANWVCFEKHVQKH